MALSFVAVFGIALTVLSTTFISALSSEKIDPMQLISKLTNPTVIGVFFVLFFLLTIVMMVIQFLIIRYVDFKNQNKEFQTNAELGKIIRVIPAVIGLSLSTTFLMMGGMWLLIVPGFLISIWLMMSMYALVLDNMGVVASMKESLRVVLSSFLSILLRFGFLIILGWIMGIFLQLLQGLAGDSTVLLLVALVVQMAVQYLFQFYAIAYVVLVYRDAQVVAEQKEYSLRGITLTAILGWMFFAVIVVFVGKVIRSNWETIQSAITKEYSQMGELGQDSEKYMQQTQNNAEYLLNEESETNVYATDCGISVPVPSTTDGEGVNVRKWVVDGVSLTGDSFLSLSTDAMPRDRSLAYYISYKKEASKLSKIGTISVDDPSLIVRCIENPQKLSLEEFIGMVKSSQEYSVVVEAEQTYGEIDTVSVLLSDKKTLEPVMFGLVAVSEDGQRLIEILPIFNISEEDPQATKIQEDLLNMFTHLKSRPAAPTLLEL